MVIIGMEILGHDKHTISIWVRDKGITAEDIVIT